MSLKFLISKMYQNQDNLFPFEVDKVVVTCRFGTLWLELRRLGDHHNNWNLTVQIVIRQILFFLQKLPRTNQFIKVFSAKCVLHLADEILHSDAGRIQG